MRDWQGEEAGVEGEVEGNERERKGRRVKERRGGEGDKGGNGVSAGYPS